ncbi:MAG TPA: hypothetical protein P5277_05180 [Candidatus Paceibacterota bacterium]|nr:hypothetical protein [Candidatus Paceibacterota bacterium]
MEISINKRTNGHYQENPAIGEIIVQVKNQMTTSARIEIDEQKLDTLLEEYVDKAENYGDFDIEVEEQILALGINSIAFNEMKKELELLDTKEYNNDSFSAFINFPWKEWKEKLLIK